MGDSCESRMRDPRCPITPNVSILSGGSEGVCAEEQEQRYFFLQNPFWCLVWTTPTERSLPIID